MDRRPQHARRPSPPTKGSQVLRIVDKHGSISFAGTGYRVGNRYVGTTVEVRLVGDTVQIALDGALLRTHRARHDKTKEFGALAQPKGKPRGCGCETCLRKPERDTGGETAQSA